MKKIIAFLYIVIFAGCAAQKFAPTEEEIIVMKTKVPGITYAEAQQGYKLYVNNCSACHRLHNPKEYTASAWNNILPEMFEKAKLSGNIGDKQAIKNFLIAKSK